jgi:hypothetical protein
MIEQECKTAIKKLAIVLNNFTYYSFTTHLDRANLILCLTNTPIFPQKLLKFLSFPLQNAK